MPNSCAATPRAWSTSRASASCPSTTAAAARSPVRGHLTIATWTPTAPTPGAGPRCSRASCAREGEPTSSTGSTTRTRTRPCWARTRRGPSPPARCPGRCLFGRRPRPYPGFHPDDWEGHQVRIDRDGSVAVRSTSHGHHQWCKQAECRGRWGPRTGWTRVSRGSHAGHIPLERSVGGRRGVRYRPRIPGWTCASARARPRASSWCRWSGSTSAATGGWARGCHRHGASARTTGLKIAGS